VPACVRVCVCACQLVSEHVCMRACVRCPRQVRGLASGVDPAQDLTWAIVSSGTYVPEQGDQERWIKFDWGQNIKYDEFSVTASGVAMRNKHLDSQLPQMLLRCLLCLSVAAKGMLRKPDTISPKTNIGKDDTLALAATMKQALKAMRLPEGALLRPRLPRCEQCSTLPE